MSNRNKGGLIFGGKRRLEKSNVGKSYRAKGRLYLRRRDGSWLIDRLFAARWKIVAAAEPHRNSLQPSRQVERRETRPWEDGWLTMRRDTRKRINRAAFARARARGEAA
jgi:hypothetical protein